MLLTTINQVLCNYDRPYNPHQRQRSPGANPSLSLPTMEKTHRYSNDWAIEIYGGSEMADRIARKFGFVNLGLVKEK